MANPQFLNQLSRRLADEGKLIEAGWISLRLYAMSPDAPPVQLREMRMAYMAGAQHLFASIMGILDPGVQETPGDMRRLDLIQRELLAFGDELKRWAAATPSPSQPGTP